MAASRIGVTAGAGTNVATNSYTESGFTVHDEKVILGEQYHPTYTVVDAMSTATANAHLLQIMAGASLRVRIRRIEIYQDTLATTATIASLSIYRLTTAGTGGVAVTPRALDPADAAAGATAMRLPTAKGTEGNQLWTGNVYYMQTAGASSIMQQPAMVLDFDGLRQKPIIVAAGVTNGIAIKHETAVAGAIARITVVIDETAF